MLWEALLRAIVLILALAFLGSCADIEGLLGGDDAGAEMSQVAPQDPATSEQDDPATAPPAPENPAPEDPAAGEPAQEEPAAGGPSGPEAPGEEESLEEESDIEAKSPQQIACERGGGLFAPVSPGSTLRTCLTRTRDFKRQCSSGADCQGVCLARSRTCAPVVPLLGCNEILLEGGTTVVDCIR